MKSHPASPVPRPPSPAPRPPNLEAWLQSNYHWVALAILAAGFVIKILVALPTFLNSDEIDNYMTTGQPTFAAVFREALISPHPPLFFLLLHLWTLLGHSDFMLRLFSILAGTAGLWLAFRWLDLVFSHVAAIAGLLVLTFAPSLTAAMTEVRQYALLFLLVATTLLLLEAGFRRQSSRLLAAAALTSGLAVYTHASGVWFAIAFGICGLMRVIVARPPRPAVMTWLAGQVFTAGLCLLLYLTQFARLRGGQIETFVQESWLRNSYFRPGQESAFLFAARQTVAVFRYIYSHPISGIVMLAGFVAGIVLLLSARANPGRGKPGPSRLTALWLVCPFVVFCLGALAKSYPYGDSRHDVVLALFAVAAICPAVALLVRRRILPLLLGAAVLVPIWMAKAVTPAGQSPLREQRRELIQSAVEHIRRTVPPGAVIFSDNLNRPMLRHYLCQSMVTIMDDTSGGFRRFDCAGYRLVSSMRFFNFPPDSFGDEFARMARRYGLPEGETVYVASMGWGTSVALRLFRRYGLEYAGTRVISARIALVPIPVGSEPSSANLQYWQATVGNSLRAMALSVRSLAGARFSTVFWPTLLLDDSTRDVAPGLSDRVLSYSELYADLGRGGTLESYLPALAFWQLGTREVHPEFMRYMDDAANYISGGYRFTLAQVSQDSLGLLYLVEPAGPAQPIPAPDR